MKLKVVCVYGEVKKGKDFVIESVCGNKDCKVCEQESFWIEVQE